MIVLLCVLKFTAQKQLMSTQQVSEMRFPFLFLRSKAGSLLFYPQVHECLVIKWENTGSRATEDGSVDLAI